MTSGVLADPCPSATAAVLGAVASTRLTPLLVTIRAGYFLCGGIWVGAGSEPVCFGAFEFPGRNMHAWVSFVGTAKVAAVSLQRDVPVSGTPPPSAPPWHATLEALTVPPTTFVMP